MKQKEFDILNILEDENICFENICFENIQNQKTLKINTEAQKYMLSFDNDNDNDNDNNLDYNGFVINYNSFKEINSIKVKTIDNKYLEEMVQEILIPDHHMIDLGKLNEKLNYFPRGM